MRASRRKSSDIDILLSNHKEVTIGCPSSGFSLLILSNKGRIWDILNMLHTFSGIMSSVNIVMC